MIFYRYALKNAIIPTIAVLGVGLGSLMGGAIFVEVIFARPGLGTLIYDSIQSRNYPIVRGGVLVVAILFVLANLLADLCYRVLDPRIRDGGGALMATVGVAETPSAGLRPAGRPRTPEGGRAPPIGVVRPRRGQHPADRRGASRASSHRTPSTSRTSRRASRVRPGITCSVRTRSDEICCRA